MRSTGLTRPSFSSACICARSAEKKISTGAPARIWRARSFEPPKLNDTVWPVAVSKPFAASSSASVRLAAANTETSSARAGSAVAAIAAVTTARKVRRARIII